MNFHLFIPVEQISKEFNELVNMYPVSPYLDSRDAFISWTHFIHNKINEKLEKPKISLEEFYIHYYDKFKPINKKNKKWIIKIIYLFIIILLFILIWKLL